MVFATILENAHHFLISINPVVISISTQFKRIFLLFIGTWIQHFYFHLWYVTHQRKSLTKILQIPY
jgi:hypothetical protein